VKNVREIRGETLNTPERGYRENFKRGTQLPRKGTKFKRRKK